MSESTDKGFRLLCRGADFDPGRLPIFAPRFPWRGAHLQTARNNLVGPRGPGPEHRPRDLILPLRDDGAGKLTARLESPDGMAAKGAILMLHGLGGHMASTYMRLAARFFLAEGYHVARLNMRGADSSAPHCTTHYHAGLTEDIEDAIAGLPGEVRAAGLHLVGFSLGANIIFKLFGEGGPALEEIRAGLAVSAPLDLAASLAVIDHPDNWIYRQYLVGKLRQTHRLVGPAYLNGPGQLSAIRGIRQYDEAVVAPMHGFADAADYYEKCSGKRFLRDIEAPLLVVHAANDPWIPAAIYTDTDWPQNGAVTAVLTRDGGHMGFHGAGSPWPWYLRAGARFFEGR